MNNLDLYNINNEYSITELLSHFDSDFIINIMRDKLNNINNYSSLPEPNIVSSFESNFNEMKEMFPDDSMNINMVRERVYCDIINILCERFNLSFNYDDETINKYTAAFYLYDFLVCNFNKIMVDFFTSFIINNKDSIYNILNLETYKKNKDASTLYNKKLYNDQKYMLISANLEKVINHISNIDVTLINIFQSTYPLNEVVMFLDNAIGDRGDFYKNHYCSIIQRQDLLPIILTDIRLRMQTIVGNANPNMINEFITKNENKGE